jgi:hypothetical protein
LLVVALCACSRPPPVTSFRAVPPDLTFSAVRAGQTFVVPYWRVPTGFVRGASAPVARVECTIERRGAEIEAVTCANLPLRTGDLAGYRRLYACATPREAVAPASTLRELEAAIRSPSGPTRSPPGLVVALQYRTRTHVPPPSPPPASVQIATDHLLPDTVEENINGVWWMPSDFVIDRDAGSLLLSEVAPERHGPPSPVSRWYWFDPRFTIERVIDDRVFFRELARAMDAIDPSGENRETRLAYHGNRLLLAAHAGDRAALLAEGARLAGELEEMTHGTWTPDFDREVSWLRELGRQLERFAGDNYSLRDPCSV